MQGQKLNLKQHVKALVFDTSANNINETSLLLFAYLMTYRIQVILILKVLRKAKNKPL